MLALAWLFLTTVQHSVSPVVETCWHQDTCGHISVHLSPLLWCMSQNYRVLHMSIHSKSLRIWPKTKLMYIFEWDFCLSVKSTFLHYYLNPRWGYFEAFCTAWTKQVRVCLSCLWMWVHTTFALKAFVCLSFRIKEVRRQDAAGTYLCCCVWRLALSDWWCVFVCVCAVATRAHPNTSGPAAAADLILAQDVRMPQFP